jgi:hypothetical protein
MPGPTRTLHLFIKTSNSNSRTRHQVTLPCVAELASIYAGADKCCARVSEEEVEHKGKERPRVSTRTWAFFHWSVQLCLRFWMGTMRSGVDGTERFLVGSRVPHLYRVRHQCLDSSWILRDTSMSGRICIGVFCKICELMHPRDETALLLLLLLYSPERW